MKFFWFRYRGFISSCFLSNLFYVESKQKAWFINSLTKKKRSGNTSRKDVFYFVLFGRGDKQVNKRRLVVFRPGGRTNDSVKFLCS